MSQISRQTKWSCSRWLTGPTTSHRAPHCHHHHHHHHSHHHPYRSLTWKVIDICFIQSGGASEASKREKWMSGQTAAGGGATDVTSQSQVRLLETKNSHIFTLFNCSDLYMPLKVCAGPWGSVQVAEGLKRSCRSQTLRHKKTDTLECDVTSCNFHHRTTEKMQNTLRMSLSFLQYLSPTNTVVCFHSNTANSWFSSLSINKI